MWMRSLSTKRQYSTRFWKEGRGGTDPPDAKFLAVAAMVVAAGGYAWLIDPPINEPSPSENDSEPTS